MQRAPILCPTDFSDVASLALTYAIEQANFYNVDLLLMHIISNPFGQHDYGIEAKTSMELEDTLEAFTKQKLNEIQAQIQDKLNTPLEVHRVIRCGDALAQIIAEAALRKPSMIVMASHGHQGLSHLLSPNIAEGVVKDATCPVLVIKRGSTSVVR